MEERYEIEEVLEVAKEAGRILLQNGAEIFRVEDTMARIASHYGVKDHNFYVLSNAVFVNGSSPQGEGFYTTLADVPMKGAILEKVVMVNQLSRDINKCNYSLQQARAKLKEIDSIKPKPWWEVVLGSILATAGFCGIFGGGMLDCTASAVVGFLMGFFMAYVFPHLSKIAGNILGSALAAALCILFWSFGFGTGLSQMIIGSVILFIPGVAFANGIRELAAEDYVSGVIKLLDAILVFFCITLGVCISLFVHGLIFGGMITL